MGLGLRYPRRFSKTTGISPDTRARDLTEEEIAKLREVIDKGYKVEGDLRREESLNIKRLIEIGSLSRSPSPSGIGLCGDKRTKTNARTRKGREKRSARNAAKRKGRD